MNKDYCIQIHTYYKDYGMLIGCLKSIRAHLDAPVQVVCDGAYMTLAQVKRVNSFGDINIVLGERIMLHREHGCKWIVRKLKLLLNTKHDLFLCFDTDARVWRRPLYIPDTSYFGNLVSGNLNKVKYIGSIPQGGCWGMTRKFVEQIYEGGYFNDDTAWQSLQLPFVRNMAGIIADDFYIPHIAVHHLRLYPHQWDEVLAVWNRVPQNPLINGIPRYAFTHSWHKYKGE